MLNSKSNKDKVQHFAPIWLDEIRDNKIYKKYSERNQKIEDGKKNEEETETVNDKLENENDPEKDAVQSSEETENSRTESDQVRD